MLQKLVEALILSGFLIGQTTANPQFSVSWRFGNGLPPINDSPKLI